MSRARSYKVKSNRSDDDEVFLIKVQNTASPRVS